MDDSTIQTAIPPWLICRVFKAEPFKRAQPDGATWLDPLRLAGAVSDTVLAASGPMTPTRDRDRPIAAARLW